MRDQERDERSLPWTTVLFTDMVESTARAAAIGDRAWAELLALHNGTVRAAVLAHGGRVMDSAGDGFFVIFNRPADALTCARAAVDELATLDIPIRCGLHTGDCLVVDDKCTGLAIHIGARLAAMADPGEILVSDAVRREAGTGFTFVDRGAQTLRGVPGAWHLFSLAT